MSISNEIDLLPASITHILAMPPGKVNAPKNFWVFVQNPRKICPNAENFHKNFLRCEGNAMQ